MRRVSVFLLVPMLLLSACAKPAPAGYDPAATASALLESAAFSEGLEELDLDIACMIYGLEEEAIAEGVVYASTGATAEEIAVLRLKGEKDAEAAVPYLQERVTAQRLACADYLPAELPKLDAAIIERRGDTVVLIVAADAVAAQRVLGEVTK